LRQRSSMQEGAVFFSGSFWGADVRRRQVRQKFADTRHVHERCSPELNQLDAPILGTRPVRSVRSKFIVGIVSPSMLCGTSRYNHKELDFKRHNFPKKCCPKGVSGVFEVGYSGCAFDCDIDAASATSCLSSSSDRFFNKRVSCFWIAAAELPYFRGYRLSAIAAIRRLAPCICSGVYAFR